MSVKNEFAFSDLLGPPTPTSLDFRFDLQNWSPNCLGPNPGSSVYKLSGLGQVTELSFLICKVGTIIVHPHWGAVRSK